MPLLLPPLRGVKGWGAEGWDGERRSGEKGGGEDGDRMSHWLETSGGGSRGGSRSPTMMKVSVQCKS